MQLDLVRRGGAEVEDASGELLGDDAADDRLRADAEQRQPVAPRGLADDAVPHRHHRIVVVVTRDRELDTERHERRPVETRRADVEHVVAAGVDARVVRVEPGEPPHPERVLHPCVEAGWTQSLRDQPRSTNS